MKKIKITEEQYEKILLHEQKKYLNENTNNILLVIASLAGVNLTGHNKSIADKSKQNSDIINKVKSTLENSDKMEDLLDKLEEKGLENPKNFITRNSEKIIKNFNEISDNKLDFLAKSVLRDLNKK